MQARGGGTSQLRGGKTRVERNTSGEVGDDLDDCGRKVQTAKLYHSVVIICYMI